MNTVNQSYEQRIKHLQDELKRKETELHYCKKSKDEFIDVASHDLKAPMRKLRTFSERLVQKSEGLDEELMIYVRKIEKTVASMQSLLDGLSSLSDIGTKFDLETCDLNEIMEDVFNESSGLITKNHVSFDIKDLPTLDADYDQMKNVFKNLLENSVKFQPEGQSAKITVESELMADEQKIKFNLPENKVYFQIKFADNGIGFNQKNAEVILKPFERLNGISNSPGNGLGLAICKKIIDMHSGILLVQGKENMGSVFTLILPKIHQ